MRMSKRKAEGSIDGAALKKSTLTAAITQHAPRAGRLLSTVSQSTSGDIGLVESISLKNFMCHRSLGPFQFGPNVNFIVGSNGSGKSVILTALIVGLGGKATMTNRGACLKDFVKVGETKAIIRVKLRNKGADAYRKDVYGDCITVEHRVFCDGSRTCKVKNGSGQLVSNKKEELLSILDHFNVQLDNPVSILSQEMSKQFLHSKNQTDKYKFFMRATLLEQMKRDYIHIKHTETITRQQIERQEESLKDLKLELLQKKERYENLSTLSQMNEELETLNKKMAWCLSDMESNHKPQDNLRLCQTKLLQAEKKLQDIKSRAECLREEQESLKKDSLRLKEQDKDKARRVMQQGPPPRNCREAFTAEGDQVFLNRYYTSDCSVPKYLSGDIETEISVLEAELENQKAHLRRFQLQVSSVTTDIENMESSVNSTFMNLKKTALSINRVKVAITELEMDEQPNDICCL